MIASCFVTSAIAQETKTLSSVVVTATRVEQDSFDLPMAIDKVEKSAIEDSQLRMTLSESLARVPGITAQNRNQMAQDPQISSAALVPAQRLVCVVSAFMSMAFHSPCPMALATLAALTSTPSAASK